MSPPQRPQTHPKKLETLSCTEHAQWLALNLLEMVGYPGASVPVVDYPREGQTVCEPELAFLALRTGVRRVVAVY